jgi:predicted alpha/beta-hydrolase family hydrolase
MTSQAQAAAPLAGVRGIVFVGFPLHPAGRPGTARAEHLAQVGLPMLFLQGTRDELAGLELLRPVVRGLRGAEMHLVDGADHSFRLPAREARVRSAVAELAEASAAWMAAR